MEYEPGGPPPPQKKFSRGDLAPKNLICFYSHIDINLLSQYVLGSEKIRLMERKMKNEILGSAYSPAKTLQNELCLMKTDQSSQKIQSFEFESQHST